MCWQKCYNRILLFWSIVPQKHIKRQIYSPRKQQEHAASLQQEHACSLHNSWGETSTKLFFYARLQLFYLSFWSLSLSIINCMLYIFNNKNSSICLSYEVSLCIHCLLISMFVHAYVFLGYDNNRIYTSGSVYKEHHLLCEFVVHYKNLWYNKIKIYLIHLIMSRLF